MVGNLTTHTACWHRKPKRVVTISDEFAIRKDQNLPTLRGLERTQTPLLLPVAGEVFPLDSPLYRTRLPSMQIPDRAFRFADLADVERVRSDSDRATILR